MNVNMVPLGTIFPTVKSKGGDTLAPLQVNLVFQSEDIVSSTLKNTIHHIPTMDIETRIYMRECHKSLVG